MNKLIKIYFVILFFITIENSFSQVNQEWTARYSATTNSIDGGKKILVDKDNNIYVIGASFNDFVIIKYNSIGNQLWLRRYNGIGNGTDIPTDMITDTEGNIYVTGSSDFNKEQTDFLTIKYNPEGIEEWVARYSCTGNENFPTSIIIDTLNNIYITGKNFNNITTIQYNSDGNQIWVTDYHAPIYNDIAWGIALDNLRNVYITGEYSNDCIVVKYNAFGVQQWVSTYNGKSNRHDFNQSISIDNLSNVYVSGSSTEDSMSLGGYLTIKYNSKGDQQWVRTYEGTGNFFDVVQAMKVDKSGNIYITGYSTETGQGYNMTTFKYNPNGDILWKASYNNGLNDIAFGITIDNQGSVYITGWSDGIGIESDYATVKYDSSGNQLWSMRYDFSGQYGDFPSSIAVDLNGSVFVTGQSNRDILTIKYSQPTGVNPISLETPTVFKLDQNYPNPFNPETVISYHLQISSEVKLKIYNVLGNETKTLVEEKQNSGSYSVTFDGSGYPSGVYLYRLEINENEIDTKRMVLLK